MKICSEQEFIDTIKASYPAKYSNADFEPSSGFRTIFVLDTLGECQLSYDMKDKLSTYTWCGGRVIKDDTGLFANFPNPNTNPFLTVLNSNYLNGNSIPSPSIHAAFYGNNLGAIKTSPLDSITITIPINGENPKCVCGAHKTGSNKHSSWCDIKENA